MKSNMNNRKAMFGRLGVVSLMALSLSSQSLFAAGIDLWYLSGPNKGDKLESIVDADKKEAVEWLAKLEVAKFVEKFASKPIQFIEALQETLKKNSDKEFKDKLKDAFKTVEAKSFGGDKQKEAYLSIVERALTAKADSEEFSEVAFASAKDREALNVTVIKPVKPAKTEVGEQDDAEFKALCDSLKKKQEEFDRIAKLMEDLKVQSQKDKQESNQKLANAENLLADLSARQSQLQEQSSQFDPAALAKNNQQKDAADVLNGLLSGLVADQNKKNAEEEVAPAQNNNQFPFFPQNSRLNNQGNAAAFNQPIPQNNNLMPFMQQTTPGVQVPVTYDLGATSGKAELGDAQEIIGVNDMRQSVASSISPMATVQDLVIAKAKVAADVKRTQVALQNAKDKANQLDERLEELKEGGRAALSPSVKQRLAQLKQAVDTKQSYLNQQRQMLQMLSPDQRDQLNNTLMMAQMDLSNAEQQYNQYNAQVEVAIEQANGQIKALAKQRDQLNSAASKLQSQMASLKEDETAVSQLINNQMQAQMQMMSGAGNGTPNINRIQNRGTTGRRAGLGNVVNPQGFVRPSLAK